MSYAVIDSPVGPLTLVGSDDGRVDRPLHGAASPPAPELATFGVRDDSISPDVVRAVGEYFDGTAAPPSTYRCGSSGRRSSSEVWTALQDIPYGETTTYGELAVPLGLKPARVAGGRAGEREEPDQHHRAVPPGGRLDRQPDRVRRRPRAQAAAARPRAGRRALLKPSKSAHWVSTYLAHAVGMSNRRTPQVVTDDDGSRPGDGRGVARVADRRTGGASGRSGWSSTARAAAGSNLELPAGRARAVLRVDRQQDDPARRAEHVPELHAAEPAQHLEPGQPRPGREAHRGRADDAGRVRSWSTMAEDGSARGTASPKPRTASSPPTSRPNSTATRAAAEHFQSFPPSSKRRILEWIALAKRPETRQSPHHQPSTLAATNQRANHPT